MVDFDLADYSFIDLNTFQLTNEPTYTVSSNKAKVALALLDDEPDIGVCKICGRKLRGIDSCQLGMGPICFKKYKETLIHTKTLF